MAKVTAELTSGLVTKLSNGRHEWVADEPPEAQGTDQGPNPYDLLLGALGACTCITLRLYCRHKEIRLDSVRATYEHSRIKAEECEGCQKKQGLVDHITGHVSISGDFTEQERKRLAEVATRCPVHRTLTNEIHLSDHVEFG